MRPARLALTRDAFVILGLIFFIVLTELVGDSFAYVVEPDHPSRTWALLAGPLSLALEGIGPEAALTGFGAMAWAHILLVLALPRVPAVQQAPPHHQQRAERLHRRASSRAARCA